MREVKIITYGATTSVPTSSIDGWGIANSKYLMIGVTATDSVSYRVWLKINDTWFPDNDNTPNGISTVTVENTETGKEIDVREVNGFETMTIEITEITGTATFDIATSK